MNSIEIEKEVLKGYVDTIILSCIHLETLYGYELVKRIREISGGEFEIKEATIYFSLKRLERNGYASSNWDDFHVNGGVRRKYYTITDIGTNRLMTKKKEWNELKEQLDKYFRRVSFGVE